MISTVKRVTDHSEGNLKNYNFLEELEMKKLVNRIASIVLAMALVITTVLVGKLVVVSAKSDTTKGYVYVNVYLNDVLVAKNNSKKVSVGTITTTINNRSEGKNDGEGNSLKDSVFDEEKSVGVSYDYETRYFTALVSVEGKNEYNAYFYTNSADAPTDDVVIDDVDEDDIEDDEDESEDVDDEDEDDDESEDVEDVDDVDDDDESEDVEDVDDTTKEAEVEADEDEIVVDDAEVIEKEIEENVKTPEVEADEDVSTGIEDHAGLMIALMVTSVSAIAALIIKKKTEEVEA